MMITHSRTVITDDEDEDDEYGKPGRNHAERRRGEQEQRRQTNRQTDREREREREESARGYMTEKARGRIRNWSGEWN